MSNYENLMKKVILEAIEREKLEERFDNISYATTDDDFNSREKHYSKKAEDLIKKFDLKSNALPKVNFNQKSRYERAVNNLKKFLQTLSKLNQPDDSLTSSDFEKLGSQNIDQAKLSSDDEAIRKAEIEKLKNQIQAYRNIQASLGALKNVTSDQGIVSDIDELSRETKEMAKQFLNISLKSIDDVQIATDDDSLYDPSGGLNFQTSDVEISQAEGTGSDYRSIKSVKIAPSVKSTIDAIAGENLLKKLESIERFANEVTNAYTSKVKLDPNSEFSHPGTFMAYLSMMKLLAQSAREYESSAAGPFFETIMAFLIRGVVVGGESGSADMAAFSDAGKVFYSSKFLVPTSQVEQSNQPRVGIDAMLDKYGTMYYVVCYKMDLDRTKQKSASGGRTVNVKGSDVAKGTTVASDYKMFGSANDAKELDIYIVAVKPVQPGTVALFSVSPDGSENPLGEVSVQSGVYKWGTKWISAANSTPMARIPIMSMQGADKIFRAVNKYHSQIVDETTNNGTKLLKKVLVNMQKIKEKTQVYTSQKDLAFDKHEAAIAEVQKLRDEIKQAFNEMLTTPEFGIQAQAGKTVGTKDKDLRFDKSTAQITESNQLIDTIREMVEKELKDIDFE